MTEVQSFREWLNSLSHDDLLRAMEFDMEEQEYSLLQEMVKLQTPPPTPIHPGILGYRPASSSGATDGRNEEERIHKARFETPRMFQLMETVSMVPTRIRGNGRSARARRSTDKRYDVIARRKITPWGEVLSIGCTQAQRDADDTLLKETRIHHAKDRNRCVFCLNQDKKTNDVLRILHVASRGKFASMPFTSSSPPFCAPWINAELEWFSLPMFLASRWEVALWSSYRRRASTPFSSWSDPIQGAVEKLNSNALKSAILSAAAHAVSKDMFPKDEALRLTRDGVIWNLLDFSRQRYDSDESGATMKDAVTSIGTVAIVDLNSPKHMFQLALWSQFQETIAAESEKEILRSLANETSEAPGNTSSNTSSSSRRKRVKNKRKKRKEKYATRVVESKSEEHGPRNEPAMTALQMPLRDPHSIENARANTRKVIMMASILDDVLEGVFDKLGLNYPSDEETVEDTALSSQRMAKVETKQNERKKRSHPRVAAYGSTDKASISRNQQLNRTEEVPAAEPVPIPIKDDTIFPGLPAISAETTNDAPPFPQDPPAYGSALSNDVFQHRNPHLESDFFSVPWMFDETVGWDKLNRYPNRDRSLLADLFLSQKRDGDGDIHVASSTAASIASSSDKGSQSSDGDSVVGGVARGDDDKRKDDPAKPVAPVLEEAVLEAVAASINKSATNEVPLKTLTTNEENSEAYVEAVGVVDEGNGDGRERSSGNAAKDAVDECRSPSPHAPQTPPPQLSPILVSLADLQTIRARAVPEDAESPKARSFSAVTAESLPSSPLPASATTLAPSWSREDLRINTFTDDQRLHSRSKGFTIKKRTSAPLSYRNVAVKTLPKSRSSVGGERKPPVVEVAPSEPRSTRSSVRSATSIPDYRRSASSRNESDACAQSEATGEALSYEVPLNDTTRMTTRDNTEVTISTKEESPPKSPPRGHSAAEEIATLRDERNAFRDQCLTLGAEVSKLKNLLAAQTGSSSFVGPTSVTKSSYDPEFMPPYFHGVPKATTTVGAMSDAGTHRGDHDSAFSEDGTDGFGIDSSGRPSSVHVRRMSSTATMAASDLSTDQDVTGQAMLGTSGFRSLSRDVIGSISGHGMQSRLTTDILNFLRAKSAALKMQDKRKTMAIERLTRLVTALWPRAQVKIYGSHVTGLCLPSSDLDFVVCLPAVHKNAPAVAPGALEGRNAINESSQKTLARMLKGESWIDPRSIKIISRTIVPVIKVSTKDTRARTIQLDISFDSLDHHGVAANLMITEVMQELPVIQPLVLVLKQFLQDRSLLTAYTGGLSSYGLFLMVTRYLQEQQSSWGDCGSLLMGFLDFYGNSFDPRATGISVRRRQYFPRMNYAQPQPMWDVGNFPQPHMTPSPSSSVGGRPDLVRRNSFNENATMDGPRFTVSATTPHAPRPPLFQPSSSHHRLQQQYKHPTEETPPQMTFDQAGRPYTFDPLFIEDPLSEGNNVGRNAFRIFQVQRAFSDAHRALVASLEWDIHSSQDVHDGGEYPLLNCLLQSEDVFYELEEA